MRSYKVLSLLLGYPSEALQDNMEELKVALQEEGALKGRYTKKLYAFMDRLAQMDLLKLQEQYVALFDRSRTNSLYIFEHVHGESRDRGGAMVDLSETYEKFGYKLDSSELPDYLPLFLEFLSVLPPEDAQAFLRDAVHVIATVGAKLGKKESGYQYIFKAIEQLADTKIDPELIAQALLEAEQVDESMEALDKEWEETPAFDGMGGADCGGCPTTPSAPKIH